jgi:hypothetical protein
MQRENKVDTQQHLYYGHSKSPGFEHDDPPASDYSSSRRRRSTRTQKLGSCVMVWSTTRLRRGQQYAFSLLDGDDAVSLQGLPSQFYAPLAHGMVQSNKKQCSEVGSLFMQDIAALH